MPAEIYIRQIGQRDHGIAGRCIDAGLLLLTLVLVVSDTMKILFFDHFSRRLLVWRVLDGQLRVILLFAGIAALQGDLFILIIFLATATFFLCYYLYFIVNADRPLNFNSLGSYYGVLAVIVFYVLARHKLLPLTIENHFPCLCGVPGRLCDLSQAGLLGLQVSYAYQKAVVDIADTDSENRVFMLQAAAIYVAAYSVSKLQDGIQIGYILTLALAGVAAYLSATRTLIVCSLLVFVLYLSTGRMKLVERLQLYRKSADCHISDVRHLDPGFNPYWFGTTGDLILARAYEFDVVAEYVRNAPVFGIGLPDATEGLTHFLGKVIYPSDLSIVGIWFQFGIVGMVLLGIAPDYISCIQDVRRSSQLIGEADARTLSLAGCVIGLIGGMDLYIGSALLFSLIFANTLCNAPVSLRHAAPGRNRAA